MDCIQLNSNPSIEKQRVGKKNGMVMKNGNTW